MTRAAPFAALVLAAAAIAGCVVHAHGHGHGPPSHGGSVFVEHGHHYVFYPSYRAYYCSIHEDWWAEDRGTWVRFTVRPPHVKLTADVTWIVIDDDGPEPFVRVEDHLRRGHGGDDRGGPGRGKGPPPGRGWRR
jgi:hypothetical protein